jgi:hypothetical protein
MLLELFIKREHVMFGVACSIDSTFCVFAHSFLKEVCFALEGNSIHPWEWVDYIVDSRLFHFAEEAICTELNVLVHEGCIHTHEVKWECLFADKMFFNLDCTVNNLPDADRARRFEQVVVEDTGKITVKSFIAADSLFAKYRPGSTQHCLNQKMAQKEPEKKMPSTTAKAMRCLANEACFELHHISAHFALAPANGRHCFNCIVYFILFLFVLDIATWC